MKKMQILAGTFALALAVSAALPQDALARRMGGGRSFGHSSHSSSGSAVKGAAAGFAGGLLAGHLFGRHGEGGGLLDLLLIGGGVAAWFAWRSWQRRKEQEERAWLMREKWSVQNRPMQDRQQDGGEANGGGMPAGQDPAEPGASSRPAWR